MPVTNPVALPAIAFSKNLLKVVLQSDDYLAAPAVKSVNFLEFDAAVVEDDELILSWINGAASMTAKDTPDDSGLQFPSGDGSNTYVTSLLPWFEGNYFLSRDYVITTDFGGANPRLIFTAIKNGPDFDFTDTDAGAAGVVTPGVTDEPIENFMHHLELFIAKADGSAFDQCFSANIPLDYPITGNTTADIHEALHAYLSSDVPELSAAYAVCLNSIRQYFFRFAQFFGATPFIHKLFISDTYLIAKGGLGVKANSLRTMVRELCPVVGDATKNRFLRQGSVNKPVSTEQPEWLTWINFNSAGKTISLEVVITNDDATTFTFNAAAALAVDGYQKIQFQTGYTQLNVAGRQTGKNPVYYTIRVKEDSAGYLSTTYTYVIDYTYRPWRRYFVYENSYGAFQTLAAVGKGINEFDRTKDDAEMAVDQSQAAAGGMYLECNILIQDKTTVNIGYDRSNARTTALLRDLAASHTKYVWDGTGLTPIGLNTTNLKDAADGVFVYSNSFEYYPLFTEEVYSEPSGLADDAINDLLVGAGIPPATIPPLPPGGTGEVIVVDFGDTHLSIVGGQQVYTAPALLGLTNYRIWTTQMGLYFRTVDITYGSSGFTILVDGFALASGEQLLIFPYVLNPDA